MWNASTVYGENIAFFCNVSYLANELNLPVAILSLDQEKVFDRVDWPFLLATLTKMGSGPSSCCILMSEVQLHLMGMHLVISRPCEESVRVAPCPLFSMF